MDIFIGYIYALFVNEYIKKTFKSLWCFIHDIQTIFSDAHVTNDATSVYPRLRASPRKITGLVNAIRRPKQRYHLIQMTSNLLMLARKALNEYLLSI